MYLRTHLVKSEIPIKVPSLQEGSDFEVCYVRDMRGFIMDDVLGVIEYVIPEGAD